MSVEETQQVLDEYLDALLGGGDFGAFFADDVRWTTMETGDVISGRDAVRDFIIALHTQLFDASPEFGPVICGDGSAALEATFIGKHIAEFAGVEATGAEVRLRTPCSTSSKPERSLRSGPTFRSRPLSSSSNPKRLAQDVTRAARSFPDTQISRTTAL